MRPSEYLNSYIQRQLQFDSIAHAENYLKKVVSENKKLLEDIFENKFSEKLEYSMNYWGKFDNIIHLILEQNLNKLWEINESILEKAISVYFNETLVSNRYARWEIDNLKQDKTRYAFGIKINEYNFISGLGVTLDDYRKSHKNNVLETKFLKLFHVRGILKSKFLPDYILSSFNAFYDIRFYDNTLTKSCRFVEIENLRKKDLGLWVDDFVRYLENEKKVKNRKDFYNYLFCLPSEPEHVKFNDFLIWSLDEEVSVNLKKRLLIGFLGKSYLILKEYVSTFEKYLNYPNNRIIELTKSILKRIENKVLY